jgi:pentatricopeptide repeat protein
VDVSHIDDHVECISGGVRDDLGRTKTIAAAAVDMVSDPPKPTLVTYSALMSRAVSLGKPRVALRLWNLMRSQRNFYTRVNHSDCDSVIDDDLVIPDVIFCNTLMNAYAKLGDHESARSILNAMTDAVDGPRHDGIPPTEPTVVTYNTLADACKVAGELGQALEVLDLMTSHAHASRDASLLPDARTYTMIISTVARKSRRMGERRGEDDCASHARRDVRSGGEKDPDEAFTLLYRMIEDGIAPNGMTYCALIDVCGRCSRTDLALAGLRIMLKQKSIGGRDEAGGSAYQQQALFNEVGAWTAAINACGKSGRTDTAIRLFRTMQKFGVKPNSVTCGCLTDCLLKTNPIRIAETLEVLQYMKSESLVPGEVMYTSLMGIALTLADKSVILKDGLQVKIVNKFNEPSRSSSLESEGGTPEAIVLYAELMRCLIHDGDDSSMLIKVFLVFQMMRNAGATPDLACYNALLRACAISGDIEKTEDVLRRMKADGIEPTSNTWRGTLKAARKARRSDVADFVWDAAVTYPNKDVAPFTPQGSDVELLMSIYVNELGGISGDHALRNILNRKVISLYEGIVSKSEERGLHHESLSVDEIEENQDFMLSVLRAAVSFELHGPTPEERSAARNLACEIAGLEVFQRRLHIVDRASKKALQLAQDWWHSY